MCILSCSTNRLAKQTVKLATFCNFSTLKAVYGDVVAVCVSRGLPLDERQSAAELEAVLQHHHNLQEKLAEDMLNLARNLKNNTLAAQNIIKQDNQVTGRGRPTVPAAQQLTLLAGDSFYHCFC